jgi:hypothetical protein
MKNHIELYSTVYSRLPQDVKYTKLSNVDQQLCLMSPTRLANFREPECSLTLEATETRLVSAPRKVAKKESMGI